MKSVFTFTTAINPDLPESRGGYKYNLLIVGMDAIHVRRFRAERDQAITVNQVFFLAWQEKFYLGDIC